MTGQTGVELLTIAVCWPCRLRFGWPRAATPPANLDGATCTLCGRTLTIQQTLMDARVVDQIMPIGERAPMTGEITFTDDPEIS